MFFPCTQALAPLRATRTRSFWCVRAASVATRIPRRHNQGGTMLASCHIPRRPSRASTSNAIKPHSFGVNRLYHHAHPARIISSLMATPCIFVHLPKVRPYLSKPKAYTVTRPPITNPCKYARLCRNPICPCSGASIPHNRIVIFFPSATRQSNVSPS